MKINPQLNRSRRGSAVIVMLALLFMMVISVAANTVTVNWLRRQVKLVDQREVQRLAGHTTTHSAPAK
jgi:type II secretory pathway component PulK